MFKFDFVTIGGATEDITFNTEEGLVVKNGKNVTKQRLLAFEYGSKLKTDKAYSTFGGGAANAAVSLSSLGFKTSAILPIGNDIRGEKIVNNLKSNKVNVDLIEKRSDKESSFAFLVKGKDGEHVAFVYNGVKKDFKIPDKSFKRIKGAKWIYVTSLAQGWRANLNKIFSAGENRIFWNPGYTQIKAGLPKLKKYLQQIEILGVNKSEAIELAASDPKYKNKPKNYLNNTRNLLKILKEGGPGMVVITQGEEGSQAYDGEKIYSQPVKKVKKAADTTGVGDAFHSGMVAGLEIYKGDIQKAMELGMKNSASVVGKRGAQNGLLRRKDIS
jgi:sugar/nucleoside kinase (ribokinase family)